MYNSANTERTVTWERSLMKNVYGLMTVALTITGITAWYTAASDLYRTIFSGFNGILLIIGTFALVFIISAKIGQLSKGTALGLFLFYSFLIGLSISYIFVVYPIGYVYQAFFISAGTFAAMSAYGFLTKNDLSGMGRYLMMGLFGLIIASLVNFFFRAPGFTALINYGGVLLFTLLTAYDTQKIKNIAASANESDDVTFAKLSILGALTLYLDFINLFLFILRILGRRN